MTIREAMDARHSVRQYKNVPLRPEEITELREEIDACNQESGLHLQLVTDEPAAFQGGLARYGKFRGVRNYFALVGPKAHDLDEKCGYYGERLVLKAQQMGLNTCWTALTYRKVSTAYNVGPGEKLCLVIALGRGENQGSPHRSKTADKVAKADGPMPDWFAQGIKAALLAPTAMNQQKFSFRLSGNTVTAQAGLGFYTKVDLGIAKYHFEVGAGAAQFQWG